MITYNKPKVGETIHVRITNLVETLGAFAKMPNGQDGLIHLKDIAWFNQTNILKSFSCGDEVEVKVIHELSNGKLDLSRKALLPNPRTLETGVIFNCIVKRIESFGLIVQLGDGTALIPTKEIPLGVIYSQGDIVTSVVIDNTYDSEKHHNKISMSILALHEYVAKKHSDGEIVQCAFRKSLQENDNVYAIVVFDSMIELKIPATRFIEPYRGKLIANEILNG